MTFDDLKLLIKEGLSVPYARIFLVLNVSETKQAPKLELRAMDLKKPKNPSSKLYKHFAEELKKTILTNEDLALLDLASADERPNAIYHYSYDSYPGVLGLMRDFQIGDTLHIRNFDFKKDSLTKLYGYLIYLGKEENGVLLFKKHYSFSLIKRGILFSRKKERFEEIESDETISLTADMHVLRVQGELFVLNLKCLDSIPGFTKLIDRQANKTTQKIKGLKILEDVTKFEALTDTPASKRRLARILKTSPVFTLPRETIVAFTKESLALKGRFKYSDDGQQIRLTSKRDAQNFLKLMSDAYLYSELTKQNYEAHAKEPIGENNKAMG